MVAGTATGRRIAGVIAVVTVLSTVAACGGGAEDENDSVAVVAGFYPLAEAAARVGGDRVEVTNLTPVGTEPHDVELDPDQVDQLLDADLVVYLGRGFQPAVTEIAGDRDEGSLDVLETLDLEDDDPHFWLDPRLLADAAGEVADALSAVSSADSQRFREGAERYQRELARLDAALERGLASCRRPTLVTAHDAFSYLADRYGLEAVPIAGLAPDAEPDADRLARVAEKIEAEGVTTVFSEELVSPAVAEALAREAGVETAVLNPVEGLTEEQLDAGTDYAAVMGENLAALRRALGCR